MVVEFFKSKQQIASELKICVKTLNKRLKKMGIIVPRGLIDPKTQRKIYDTFGLNKEEKNRNTDID
jgi:hypothetical protein